MPFGVRDQLDRYFVDARESRERAARELGQLPVVALRQVCADLADVLLDDVEVVEEPFAGRADVDAFVGGVAERLARFEEQVVRLLESLEERDLRRPLPGARTRCRRATARACSARRSAPSSSPRMGPTSGS